MLPFLGGRTSRSQTCAAVQLKGAAFGVRRVLTTRNAVRLLPCRALGEGPGRASSGWGATWPAPYGQARSPGCVPEQRQLQPKGSASRLGGSSFIRSISSSSPDLLFLPIAANASSQRSLAAGVSALLAAARSVGHRLLAAHSSQQRESGPAPGEGAAGNLEPGQTDRAQPERCSGQGSLLSPTRPPPKNT